jgi:Transmembrane proteins 14C
LRMGFLLRLHFQVGGTIGYVRARSVPSLVGGVAVGALYGLAAQRIKNGQDFGHELATGPYTFASASRCAPPPVLTPHAQGHRLRCSSPPCDVLDSAHPCRSHSLRCLLQPGDTMHVRYTYTTMGDFSRVSLDPTIKARPLLQFAAAPCLSPGSLPLPSVILSTVSSLCRPPPWSTGGIHSDATQGRGILLRRRCIPS